MLYSSLYYSQRDTDTVAPAEMLYVRHGIIHCHSMTPCVRHGSEMVKEKSQQLVSIPFLLSQII